MVINKRVLVIWTILILLFCIGIILEVIHLTNLKGNVADIQSISSYYLEYDMTVISNKNINTYFVKEWYKENIGSKFEYLDYMKNTFSIVLNKDSCYIKNSGNKAYILTQNIYENENISSLSYFMKMWKDSCNCKKEGTNKNDENRYVIKATNNDNCNLKEVLDNLKVDKLELVLKENKLLTYTIYSSGEEYISIVYRKQELNCNIDDSAFSIT